MNKLPEDIEKLGERIEELKARETAVRSAKEESRFLYASKVGFRVGTELLSGVLVGAALGYFLDKLLATQPWLLVTFMFLGGAAGVLNVYNFVKSEESKHKE